VVQSVEQAIYWFDTATLDGVELTSDDWIVARNPESGVLVAAKQYIPTNGDVIEVVVMGQEAIYGDEVCMPDFDGPVTTCGMMLANQTPQFYVFDASAPLESIAHYEAADETVLQNISAYVGLATYTGISLDLVTDCNSDLGGASVTSGLCGDCWGGNTGLAENYMDTDDDGVCNDGAANGDDDNCPDTENNDQWNYEGDTEGDA